MIVFSIRYRGVPRGGGVTWGLAAPPALLFEFTDLAPPLLLQLLMLRPGRIRKSPSLNLWKFFAILEFTTIFEKSSKDFQKNSQNFKNF